MQLLLKDNHWEHNNFEYTGRCFSGLWNKNDEPFKWIHVRPVFLKSQTALWSEERIRLFIRSSPTFRLGLNRLQ